jgi:PBP1b-binding outer membrane lipoprotein LpoB
MKNVIIILVGVMLLTGCGKQASQAPKQVIVKVAFTNDSTSVTTNSQMMHHSFGISFKTDTSRDTVVQQLEQLHAPILTNTPELIRAELPRKVQVELSFAVGKLTEVNYIMPPNTALEPTPTAP